MRNSKFLWGGALAANQCEGAYLCDGRLPASSDYLPDAAHGRWDAFHHPANLLSETYEYYPSREAIDFYHRFREDIKLLAESGIKPYGYQFPGAGFILREKRKSQMKKGFSFMRSFLKSAENTA